MGGNFGETKDNKLRKRWYHMKLVIKKSIAETVYTEELSINKGEFDDKKLIVSRLPINDKQKMCRTIKLPLLGDNMYSVRVDNTNVYFTAKAATILGIDFDGLDAIFVQVDD